MFQISGQISIIFFAFTAAQSKHKRNRYEIDTPVRVVRSSNLPLRYWSVPPCDHPALGRIFVTDFTSNAFLCCDTIELLSDRQCHLLLHAPDMVGEQLSHTHNARENKKLGFFFHSWGSSPLK